MDSTIRRARGWSYRCHRPAVSYQLNLDALLSSILHRFKLKADSRELTALLHKLGRPSSKPLDPLCNRRMRRKQVPEIHSQQRLNNE